MKRNNIVIDSLANTSVLDQGCGGGRYTVAWRLLGAKSATGIDISKIGLKDAENKTNTIGLNEINWVHDSVLDMPFEDESFELVFSNGVLHHTDNWEKGVKELIRVLRKGGVGWLYLIENPGGIFWDKIEILRAILRNVNKNFASKVLISFGIPNNRVFYMLDHVMVPINSRLTPEEIEAVLIREGAKNIRRLKRGTDFDRIEYIYKQIPYAEIKFGVGENRYIFSK